MTLYEDCAVANNGQTDLVMQCIANQYETTRSNDRTNLTHWLLIICGATIFFMQAGFAMLCAGCVRKKNLQNTMLKNLLDVCGGALAFYSLGYGFAFGPPRDGNSISFIGTDNFFCTGDVNPAFWFFKYAFSATAVTIIAGTLAERCRMDAYIIYSMFMTGLVYPVAARSVWSDHGFLSPSSEHPLGGIGTIDFAGSGVVHITGGMTSIVAAYVLGPRIGRFYDKRGRLLSEPKEFPGHSISLQVMGTMILWFGWYGFNPGSALLLKVDHLGTIAAWAAVNTSMGAATGALSAMFTHMYLDEYKTGDYCFNLKMTMNGLLSGLVAVTASAATVEPWGAAIIGLVAGWIYVAGTAQLERWKIDDAVDAIPVHLGNGMWGLIACGLFSSPTKTLAAYGTNEHVGFFYSIGRGTLDAILLRNQLIGLLFLMTWSALTASILFFTLDRMGCLRTGSVEEIAGLDVGMDAAAPAVENHSDEYNEDDVQSEEMEALRAYKAACRAGGTKPPTPKKEESSVKESASHRSASQRSGRAESCSVSGMKQPKESGMHRSSSQHSRADSCSCSGMKKQPEVKESAIYRSSSQHSRADSCSIGPRA